MVQFTCKSCGKEFTSKKACKSREPKYCNKTCFGKREITEDWLKKISEVKIGKPTWNKGVKMWADKPHPKGTKGMKFPHRAGENCVWWRGGVSSENELERKSAKYKEWRISVFERDNYTCKDCGVRGGKLHADHIKPFAYYPELRFDINNGQTLCVGCHYKTDTYGSKAYKYADRTN